LHHHLIRHGFEDRALVGIIALLSFITASGAVAGVLLKSDWISLATMFFAIGSLVASKLFGFAELKLVYKRLESMLSTLVVRPGRADSLVHQQSVQLQGTRNWDALWQSLVEFAEKHHLSSVQMDLNMPWLHEGYHAHWQKSELPEVTERWVLKFPLMLRGDSLGGVEFIGKQQESETLSVLAQLTELLDSLHSQSEAFIGDFEENRTNLPRPDETSHHHPGVREPVGNLAFLPSSSEAVTIRVTGAVEIP